MILKHYTSTDCWTNEWFFHKYYLLVGDHKTTKLRHGRLYILFDVLFTIFVQIHWRQFEIIRPSNITHCKRVRRYGSLAKFNLPFRSFVSCFKIPIDTKETIKIINKYYVNILFNYNYCLQSKSLMTAKISRNYF